MYIKLNRRHFAYQTNAVVNHKSEVLYNSVTSSSTSRLIHDTNFVFSLRFTITNLETHKHQRQPGTLDIEI